MERARVGMMMEENSRFRYLSCFFVCRNPDSLLGRYLPELVKIFLLEIFYERLMKEEGEYLMETYEIVRRESEYRVYLVEREKREGCDDTGDRTEAFQFLVVLPESPGSFRQCFHSGYDRRI